jgi:hypothetical protein
MYLARLRQPVKGQKSGDLVIRNSKMMKTATLSTEKDTEEEMLQSLDEIGIRTVFNADQTQLTVSS